MPNTTTRAERAERLEFAKALLLKRGFTPDQSAHSLIVDELMRKYGYADRRTARALEARAARLIRGDVVAAAMPEPGRPRTMEVLRQGESIELIEDADGDVVSARRFTVEISGVSTWLRADEGAGNDYLVRRVDAEE